MRPSRRSNPARQHRALFSRPAMADAVRVRNHAPALRRAPLGPFKEGGRPPPPAAPGHGCADNGGNNDRAPRVAGDAEQHANCNRQPIRRPQPSLIGSTVGLLHLLLGNRPGGGDLRGAGDAGDDGNVPLRGTRGG
eukprot:15450672-Alexandrium_andersonii.AAC.2